MSYLMAKRAIPELLAPIEHRGYYYTVNNLRSEQGAYVHMLQKSALPNLRTNAMSEDLQASEYILDQYPLLHYYLDPNLESDVQDINVKEMHLEGSMLHVSFEKGHAFEKTPHVIFDLNTNTLIQANKEASKQFDK